jgi:acyl carrier protein phosphodiesterase
MNWLAHVFLSEPDVEFRLGNLLADLVKGKARHGMPATFLRGTRCHQLIDAFTDYHPTVERSRERIGPTYRRFAGILVDVFYDHFLARNWKRYCPASLEQFTAELYAAVEHYPITLPERAQEAVVDMIAGDYLGSYRQVEGIAATLGRVSERVRERLGQSYGLEGAIGEMLANDDGLGQDFAEFFPLLQEYVRQQGFQLA